MFGGHGSVKQGKVKFARKLKVKQGVSASGSESRVGIASKELQNPLDRNAMPNGACG